MIFRDWVFQATDATSSQGEYVSGVRLVGVVKAKGVSYEGVGKVVMFTIEKASTLERCTEALLNETDWPSGGSNRSDRDETEGPVGLTSPIGEAQTRRDCG